MNGSGENQAPIIGFVGLGNMGWPMARNLRQAGYSLVVYDLDEARTSRFVEELGAAAASGPPTFSDCGVVVTMLPDGGAVRQAVLTWDEAGIASFLPPGSTIVDMSSASPLDTQQLGADLRGHGISLIDAPVSGGITRADAGTLTIMVGSDDRDLVEQIGAAVSGARCTDVPDRTARVCPCDEGAQQLLRSCVIFDDRGSAGDRQEVRT